MLGPSGSGKTTALFTLAGLLPPVAGEVRLAGESLWSLPAARRRALRSSRIAVVFQDMHLLGGLSVMDNLLLAPFAAGARQDRGAAIRSLERLGLDALADRKADALSRGEAQRVAVARAVLMEPRLILADEPTASLDDDNAERVGRLLVDAAAAVGAVLVIATHDRRLMTLAPGRIPLRAPGAEVAA